MSLRRRLGLTLLVPAALIVVELILGWTAAPADGSALRLALLAAAAGALGMLAWVTLGWSRSVSQPLREASQAVQQALAGAGPPAAATGDEASRVHGEVTALLAHLRSREDEHRAREADLRRQRDLALGATSDGVVLLDDHGRVVAANAAARTVLGAGALRQGTALATAPLPEPARSALAPLLETAAAPADPSGGAGGMPLASGGPGDASALAEITHTEDGALTIYRPERHHHGRLLVLRDVTDEHRFAGTQAAIRDLVLERHPVCLVELLQATLAPLARQAQEQGVTLHLPASEDRQILAVDPVKLPWVITVIVGNALRYTGRLGEVTVEVARQPGAMAVTVRDTGAGMAPEQLDRIFAPPTAPDGRRPGPGSQGLALAIAREIVVAHGGHLEADSRPGIGTEIRLILPLEEPA